MWFAICLLLFVRPIISSNCLYNDSIKDSCELDALSTLHSSSSNSSSSQSKWRLSEGAMCHHFGVPIEDDSRINDTVLDIINATNYENTVVMNLPFGFYRLRRAFLSDDSHFWISSILSHTLKYKNISTTGWDRYSEMIGNTSPPQGFDGKLLIGATKKTEYTMPRSILVNEQKAYETATLIEYTDNHFIIRMETTTPNVPYGNHFVSLTQIILRRVGNNQVEMISSVEAKFHKTPPMIVAAQIRRGMRSGVMRMFEKIGEFICSCSKEIDE